MAADEYYDAIGKVLSYILSAEDIIWRQRRNTDGERFIIYRDNTKLEFDAQPNSRYFTIIYQYSIREKLVQGYDDSADLLNEHKSRYDIEEDPLRDTPLFPLVAYNRISDIGKDAESIVTDISAYSVHSDCRIRTINSQDPTEDSEMEAWDGVEAIGLL